MSSLKTKRPRSGSISPPPFRRPKLGASPSTNTTPTSQNLAPTQNPPPIPPQPLQNPNHIRIYSWNINGATPLLQSPITQFFTSKVTKRTDPIHNSATTSPSSSPLPPTPSGPKFTPTSSTPPKTYTPLRQFLHRHSYPALLCLQEVKISPTDTKTPLLLQNAANHHAEYPTYRAFFSLPRPRLNKSNQGWGSKIYGVCTLIRADLVEAEGVETRGVEWDEEGRVLLSFLAKSRVLVVNGYWVNGTSNAWIDRVGGGDIRGTRHDAKRWFQGVMCDEWRKWEAEGWSVVAIGDVNVARSSIDGWPGIRMGVEHVRNRTEFNETFFGGVTREGKRGEERTGEWVDVWRELKGDERGYTYYGRTGIWGASCDRVDMAIVSRRLVKEGRLLAADIFNTIGERGHSDHVPLSVTIDLSSMDDSRVARG